MTHSRSRSPIDGTTRPLIPAHLNCRSNRLLLLRINLRLRRVHVRLPVHPLVQPRALEAPAIPQLECRHKSLRRILVERIRRDAQVVRGLADIHDLAHFGDKKIGTGRGHAHGKPPEGRTASAEIPADLPVVLYITRFHLSVQGFSGSCRKFKGFPQPGDEGGVSDCRVSPQPVAFFRVPHPSCSAVGTDGATQLKIGWTQTNCGPTEKRLRRKVADHGFRREPGASAPGWKCRTAWPSGPALDLCFLYRRPVTPQPQFWSSRRCRVGGAASVLLGSLVVLLGSVLARRSDGFLVSLESVSLRLFSIRASRAL